MSDQKCCSEFAQRVLQFADAQCMPIGLILGLIFGLLVPIVGSTIGQKGVMSYICIVVIFLVSGLKLNTQEAKKALDSPKSILYGITSIMVLTSLLGSFLTSFIPLEPSEFKTGIIIFFCTPCAIAYSVILTKQAGGNVAMAIFLVVVSNVLGSFITPMTLSLFVKAGGVSLPVANLVIQLVGTIFAPLVVGKALQELPFKDHLIKRTVERFNKPLTLFSNTLLACIPWMKISDSAQKGTFRSVRAEDIFSVAAWFLCVHILFLVINFALSSAVVRAELPMRKALVMTASTKTLPVAVTLISLLPADFGDSGLLSLPAIICQFVQTIFDGFLASFWCSHTTAAEKRRADADANAAPPEASGGDSTPEASPAASSEKVDLEAPPPTTMQASVVQLQ